MADGSAAALCGHAPLVPFRTSGPTLDSVEALLKFWVVAVYISAIALIAKLLQAHHEHATGTSLMHAASPASPASTDIKTAGLELSKRMVIAAAPANAMLALTAMLKAARSLGATKLQRGVTTGLQYLTFYVPLLDLWLA